MATSTGQARLHWFGLTDGYYWLQMNEKDEFFRYSTGILTDWGEERYAAEPTSGPWQKGYPTVFPPLPYADYYVVRLWEDILALLPDLLEPLPSSLAHMLATEERAKQWRERIRRWEKSLGIGEDDEDDGDENEDKEMWETFLQATMWWHHRQLDVHPLLSGPCLWFWNDGQDIHGLWDNSQCWWGDILAWESLGGKIQLPYARFLDEVSSFHTRLFSAMEERVQEAKNSWPRPDVALDLDQLEKEQHDRFYRLDRALERAATKTATDWNAVIDAMRIMDSISGLLSSEEA